MSPMTDEQLEAIRSRHAAATAGPWHTSGWGGVIPPAAASVPYGDTGVSPGLATVWDFPFEPGRTEGRILSGSQQGNLAFIGHAWQDVRDLLEEVERLRARVAELGAELVHATRHDDR